MEWSLESSGAWKSQGHFMICSIQPKGMLSHIACSLACCSHLACHILTKSSKYFTLFHKTKLTTSTESKQKAGRDAHRLIEKVCGQALNARRHRGWKQQCLGQTNVCHRLPISCLLLLEISSLQLISLSFDFNSLAKRNPQMNLLSFALKQFWPLSTR